jgi:hypothetical protein
MIKQHIPINLKISQTIPVNKRSVFITSTLLATLFLNSLTTATANFSVGALLNSQWTCIDPKLSSGGPISDIKVAELEFAPTTIKKDKTFTTVTFTKFKLKSSKGLFTAVALGVFTQTKTYKQSFIPIRPIDGVQKINFSVKVPTKEIKEIVLNITIQNPKNQKVGGSCIPTSVYTNMLPTPTPTPSPTPTASSAGLKGDPVLEKIRQRLPMLETQQASENRGTINWIVGPNVPADYQKLLEQQSKDLESAFPITYQWEGPAIVIIGDVLTWPVSEIQISDQCKNFVNRMIESWKNLQNLDKRLLAGSSYCDSQSINVIRPNPSAPQPDADLMAQEIGVQIQVNSIKLNPKIATLRLDEIVVPNWFLQGGQSINSFIAFVYKNKNITGAIDKVYLSSECRNVLLNQMRPENSASLGITNCDYTKGFASVRLMIALYGWDATERWFSGFSSPRDYEDAFLAAYGQPLAKFEALADDYWRYLYDPKYEPKELIAALNAAE